MWMQSKGDCGSLWRHDLLWSLSTPFLFDAILDRNSAEDSNVGWQMLQRHDFLKTGAFHSVESSQVESSGAMCLFRANELTNSCGRIRKFCWNETNCASAIVDWARLQASKICPKQAMRLDVEGPSLPFDGTMCAMLEPWSRLSDCYTTQGLSGGGGWTSSKKNGQVFQSQQFLQVTLFSLSSCFLLFLFLWLGCQAGRVCHWQDVKKEERKIGKEVGRW